MTFLTQLLPVAPITQVLSTNISPIKISLFTQWNFIHTTVFTMICDTIMSRHSSVLNSIRGKLTLPKVMVLSLIEYYRTRQRAEIFMCSFTDVSLKLHTTVTTRKERDKFSCQECMASHRTAHWKDFITLQTICFNKKSLTTLWACCFNHI
jgi:hypothetical protein